MTWNYRIMEFAEHLALHEVHYNADGRPESYTENPVSFIVCNDEPEGIEDDLAYALRDVRRLPILNSRVFDLPIGERPVTPRSFAQGAPAE